MNSFQILFWVLYAIGALGLVSTNAYLLRKRWPVNLLFAQGFFLLCLLLAPGPVGSEPLGWAPAWIVLVLEFVAEEGNFWRGLLPLLAGFVLGAIGVLLLYLLGRKNKVEAQAREEPKISEPSI